MFRFFLFRTIIINISLGQVSPNHSGYLCIEYFLFPGVAPFWLIGFGGKFRGKAKVLYNLPLLSSKDISFLFINIFMQYF